ncbi:hypothetical protein MSAN_00681300 [Mycena sanguinolenta]|uniref:Uncharacterized protein n=1 Tax=Mycena sanguinolenta TaxID=230812 RepID=A0A8H7DDL4_9AGAR|nr:hypothetical protein MSAN_00681300 [Mycena sanguinolenta]
MEILLAILASSPGLQTLSLIYCCPIIGQPFAVELPRLTCLSIKDDPSALCLLLSCLIFPPSAVISTSCAIYPNQDPEFTKALHKTVYQDLIPVFSEDLSPDAYDTMRIDYRSGFACSLHHSDRPEWSRNLRIEATNWIHDNALRMTESVRDYLDCSNITTLHLEGMPSMPFKTWTFDPDQGFHSGFQSALSLWDTMGRNLRQVHTLRLGKSFPDAWLEFMLTQAMLLIGVSHYLSCFNTPAAQRGLAFRGPDGALTHAWPALRRLVLQNIDLAILLDRFKPSCGDMLRALLWARREGKAPIWKLELVECAHVSQNLAHLRLFADVVCSDEKGHWQDASFYTNRDAREYARTFAIEVFAHKFVQNLGYHNTEPEKETRSTLPTTTFNQWTSQIHLPNASTSQPAPSQIKQLKISPPHTHSPSRNVVRAKFFAAPAPVAYLGSPLLYDTQLDVVFPTHDAHALQATLSALETAYIKAEVDLSSLIEQAGTFVLPLERKSTLTALSVTPYSDDIWCIDPRGVLTLHLSAESYQTLGIVGQKFPFKSHSIEHTVTLPLQPSADSLKNRQKRDAALKAWDLRRKQAGEAPWSVLYCANDASATAQFAASNGHAVRAVKCQTTLLRGIRVPTMTLPARPPVTDPDAVEDWQEDMHALFEWVGMAGLGAQRLQANDRADAYVAVYEPPQPSTVGDITCLRWRGFLSPDFVKSVVDAVLSAASPQFVSVTSQAFPTAPVSYIPPGADGLKTPARVPSADGEDTWSLLVAKEGDTKRWCLAESIGPLDKRWG